MGDFMQYYNHDQFVSNQDSITVLGDQGFRELLGDNIVIIPKDTLDDVLSNCVFLMIGEKIGISAAYIPMELIKNKAMCAFYESLYEKERDDQVHMILHEIAHYVLGHNEGMTDEEFKNHPQDKDANSLVAKWIADWENHLEAKTENNKSG